MSASREPDHEVEQEAEHELEHRGPIPKTVLRRERRVAAGLLAAIALLAIGGYATIPTEAELVHIASTDDDDYARIEAMNSMILRGYWRDKAFKDFERFNKAGPYEVRQFLAACTATS